MLHARSFEDGFRFGRPVRLPDFYHMQNRQHDTFGIAQRHVAAAGSELLRELWQTPSSSALAINPRNGDKTPFMNSSRPQIWRSVRSYEGHSCEWVFSSADFSGMQAD